MLVRILTMLTKLQEHFDPRPIPGARESIQSVAPFEHEHDDEHEDDSQREEGSSQEIIAAEQ
jgi:hypothetical protein